MSAIRMIKVQLNTTNNTKRRKVTLNIKRWLKDPYCVIPFVEISKTDEAIGGENG